MITEVPTYEGFRGTTFVDGNEAHGVEHERLPLVSTAPRVYLAGTTVANWSTGTPVISAAFFAAVTRSV